MALYFADTAVAALLGSPGVEPALVTLIEDADASELPHLGDAAEVLVAVTEDYRSGGSGPEPDDLGWFLPEAITAMCQGPPERQLGVGLLASEASDEITDALTRWIQDESELRGSKHTRTANRSWAQTLGTYRRMLPAYTVTTLLGLDDEHVALGLAWNADCPPEAVAQLAAHVLESDLAALEPSKRRQYQMLPAHAGLSEEQFEAFVSATPITGEDAPGSQAQLLFGIPVSQHRRRRVLRGSAAG